MTEQETFNPINPFELSDQDREAYFKRFEEIRWYEERGVPEVYKVGNFWNLFGIEPLELV